MARSNTNLVKWGTSLAVRIPKAIVEAAGLKPGDEVEVELQDKTIVIQGAANKPKLQQLVDGITSENCHSATYWGLAVGKETW